MQSSSLPLSRQLDGLLTDYSLVYDILFKVYLSFFFVLTFALSFILWICQSAFCQHGKYILFYVKYLRFSRLWSSESWSSGLWRHVVVWWDTAVSDDLAATIFNLKVETATQKTRTWIQIRSLVHAEYLVSLCCPSVYLYLWCISCISF
jgi:hypothetical protein